MPSTTTSTSNSVAGKRLVSDSYCRYSLELDRNNWLSELSILMRSIPKIAPTISANENDAGQDRRLNRDQPQPLQPEGDARGRPLLDLLDVDLAVAVLFEHALSNSHIGSNWLAKVPGKRIRPETALSKWH